MHIKLIKLQPNLSLIHLVISRLEVVQHFNSRCLSGKNLADVKSSHTNQAFFLVIVSASFPGRKPNIMPFNFDVMDSFHSDLMYLVPNR